MISFILACSGSGAFKYIVNNVHLGYYSAALASVLFLIFSFAYYRGKRGWEPVFGSGVLLFLHPAWTVSAMNGDCGQMKLVLSLVDTLLLIVIALSQVRRHRTNKNDTRQG